MRSEMARRSRQINLWIWIALTVLSGGSLTGLLPFDIFFRSSRVFRVNKRRIARIPDHLGWVIPVSRLRSIQDVCPLRQLPREILYRSDPC